MHLIKYNSLRFYSFANVILTHSVLSSSTKIDSVEFNELNLKNCPLLTYCNNQLLAMKFVATLCSEKILMQHVHSELSNYKQQRVAKYYLTFFF